MKVCRKTDTEASREIMAGYRLWRVGQARLPVPFHWRHHASKSGCDDSFTLGSRQVNFLICDLFEPFYHSGKKAPSIFVVQKSLKGHLLLSKFTTL